MDNKKCFFIGSRYASPKIIGQLTDVVKTHIIEYGVDTFIVGRYGNFDGLVREVLCEVKHSYEHIQLYLLFPYALTQKVDTPIGFDGTLYPDGM